MTSLRNYLPASLQTERLELELFNYSSRHYKCLFAAMNGSTAHARMGDFGVRTLADDKLTATRVSPSLLTKVESPVDVDIDLYYVMKLREGPEAGTLVGGVSLAQRSVRVPPEMGWAVLKEFQRQGYATEAAKALKCLVQDKLGVRELTAWPRPENMSSISVAKKVGFMSGGLVKDERGEESAVYILPGMKFDGSTVLAQFGD